MKIKTAKHDNSKRKKEYGIFLLYFLILLFWSILYYKLTVVKSISDYRDHNQFSIWMMRGEFETTYPGYQLLIGIPYIITGIDVEYISVAILSVFALFTVYITNNLLVELLNNKDVNKYQMLILSFLLNIIQPIFTYSIRPGYSSGNGYISPTQAVCKPFVLLAFLYTYRMYKDEKYTIKNQLFLTIVLFLSCIIKPVFAMAYIPAIGLLYFVDEILKKTSLKEKVKGYVLKIWPLFITGIVLILQYIMSFNLKIPANTGYSLSDGASIRVGFLVAWKSVISNVPLSLAFAYFFPLVLLITISTQKNKRALVLSEEKYFFRICIFYGLVSLLYMCFLYQEAHISDCNFRNAWIVTFSIIYIFCISVLYRITKEKIIPLSRIFINWGAFSVHIIMGIALYIKNII